MKAVQFFGPGDVRLGTVEEPVVVHPDDAVVRVVRSAICGSDLHLYRGDMPGMAPGSILGHEYTGVVEAVGSRIQRVRLQDRVVGTFHLACGQCPFCLLGAFHQCQEGGVLGYGALFGDYPGAQAGFVRIPHADVNLRRIPDGVGDDEAIIPGNILTTAYAAVVHVGLKPGASVAGVREGPDG